MSAESTEAARGAAGVWPTPGAVLGRGRYRLIEDLGRDDRSGARLWRGRDAVLERDVALTLFVGEAGDAEAAARIRAAVQQALRTARLETAGAARVLDVLEPGPGSGMTVAAVVAEWTPGRDLVDVVQAGLPAPSVAASMLMPLAGAVDDAHRSGLVLGCDHPQRIRVTPDGHARLAFPGAPAGTQPGDDVRGLGAALYFALTGRWALDGGPAGLPPAPRGPEGGIVSPRSLRPEVPLELSTLAVRSLAGAATGGVHTGAAVQRVLEQSAARGDAEPGRAGPRGPVWHGPEYDAPPSPERRRKLRIGVAVLVAATLVVLGWVGLQVASVFTGGGDDPPALVIEGPPQVNGAGGDAPIAAGTPVEVVSAAVYDVLGDGDPDNTETVDRLVDGDPSSSWSTDNYEDQFPEYKPGVGAVVSFTEPVVPSAVTIDSTSPGTVVEIRSAPSEDADFDETTLLATSTLSAGSTEIPLDASEPVRYLVMWVTKMEVVGEGHQSEFGELVVQRGR